jgi:anti-sigma factor RsiW
MVLECKHVWEHISGYLDGTLSPEVLEQVQRHLEHCEICSAILDSTRNILILTADERVFELPLGFSERLHARLEAEIQAIAAELGTRKEKKLDSAKPDEPSDA